VLQSYSATELTFHLHSIEFSGAMATLYEDVPPVQE